MGILLSRFQPDLQLRASRLSRTAKVVSAAGLMLFCVSFLFVPLDLILTAGGFKGGPMSLPVWSIVTMCGLVFVGANTISLSLLIPLAREAAVTEESALRQPHENPSE